MNTMRRMLLTLTVVALLFGALAMPAAVSAGKPVAITRSIWVVPGVEQRVSVGQVYLMIPAGAIPAGTAPFALTIAVMPTAGGVLVDLTPHGTEFNGEGVVLSFGPRVTHAVEGITATGPALTPAPRPYWRGNVPAFWLEHFSRYSGWF